MGVCVGSLTGGVFGSLLCAGCAVVLPPFSQMFAEVGVDVPTSTELTLSVPGWAWWVSSILWIVLMSLKDRWVERRLRERLNRLCVALVIGAGFWIVVSLFSGCVGACSLTERL